MTQLIDQFVSVTTRLPDDDRTVLIHVPAAEEPIWPGYLDRGMWYWENGRAASGVNSQGEELIVTDWMDIPQKIGRVETGVLQFGDDWPGIFLRGDNAMWYGTLLEQLLEQVGDSKPGFGTYELAGLAKLLKSCKVTSPSKTNQGE